MDIERLYREELAATHGKAVGEESMSPPTVHQSDAVTQPDGGTLEAKPAALEVEPTALEAKPVPFEMRPAPVELSADSAVDGIVDAAMRELDTAKRKAEMTLATARSQASRVYREARRDARKLLSKARQKAERLETIGRSRGENARREGYERGLAEGRQAAREEAQLQFAEAMTALTALMEDVATSRGPLAAAEDHRVAGLMLKVVERVVGTLERSVKDLLLRNIIDVVAEHFHPDEAIYIRCHPRELERIDAAVAASGMSSLSALFDGRAISLRMDASLLPGQCRVWSETGGVSIAFEERLDRLSTELLQSIESSSHDG